MTTTQYIGPRIIPVFAPEVEWDIDTAYDHLTMVQHQGETYMTRQYVPVGIQLPDSSQSEEYNDYWVHMSNWNAQVESYRQEVLTYNGRIETLENDLPIADFDSTNTVSAAISAIEDVLPIASFSDTNTVAAAIAENARLDALKMIHFDTVSDMKASTDLENGMVVLTHGFHSIGDGGAGFYLISNTGTANELNVIACGSLYATLIAGDSITPEMCGAYGDGTHDDTDAINQAISICDIVNFAAKTYLVSAKNVNPLYNDPDILLYYDAIEILDNNKSLILNPNTQIKMAGFNYDKYNVIWVHANHFSIENGTIIGERNNHTGSVGEWGACLRFEDADYGTVKNVTCKNGWGDGITVMGDAHTYGSRYIKLENVVCDNNRRNGLSLITCEDVEAINCVFSNTNGTSPQTGVDIEVNHYEYGQKNKNIRFVDCVFKDNASYGLNMISPGVDIGTMIVDNCTFINNEVILTEQISKPTQGTCTLNNPIFIETPASPIDFQHKLKNGFKLIINNPIFYNCITSSTVDNDYNGIFQIRGGSHEAGNTYGNVFIYGAKIYDDGTTHSLHLFTYPGGEKPFEVYAEIAELQKKTLFWMCDNIDSKMEIIYSDKIFLTTNDTTVNMQQGGSAHYNNLILNLSSGSRQNVYLTYALGDKATYKIYNKSASEASIYVTDANGQTELKLAIGNYMELRYDDSVNAWLVK